jgi:hypothetical protein
MEEVSILLGHSSVMVTETRYAFLEAEDVAASLGHTNVGTGTADKQLKPDAKQEEPMSRSLLNIAKRSLLRLMLSCVGLASKHAAGGVSGLARFQGGT